MTGFDGKILILTAPSGAGKTTIKSYLMQCFPSLGFSISVTTRKQRAQEQEGVDYYFRSVSEFQVLIAEDAFAEYEMVYEDQYYGSLKSEIERIWGLGQHVLFDIDVNGAISLKKLYEEKAFTIFIKPPSFEILEERLKLRKSETPEVIATRLEKARHELEYEPIFDFVLVNDQLEVSRKEAEIVTERFLMIQAQH
jgi:guanylate kinase